MVRRAGEASSMCFSKEVKEHDGYRVVQYALTVQEGDKHWVCAKPRTSKESDDCHRRSNCRGQRPPKR